MKARTVTLFVVAALLATCEVAVARAIPKLSAKDRAAKTAALPQDDRKWLEDYVAPIILDDTDGAAAAKPSPPPPAAPTTPR